MEEFSGKSSGEWTSRQKKDKTDRATGLGIITREEIVKWNQMTALRFQTGGETSDIPGLPSGDYRRIDGQADKVIPTYPPPPYLYGGNNK